MPSCDPIAVIGGDGQLGSDLVAAARARGHDVTGLSHEQVEVADPRSTQEIFDDLKPRTIINTAAFHQVDQCAEDPLEAFHVNGVGSFNVARAAETVGASYVYISTDYVFSGTKDAPVAGNVTTPENSYTETDTADPINAYGVSKLAGEQLCRIVTHDPLIVRISSLFGVAGARGKGGNFIERMLRAARDNQPLTVVNDQWMTPTYTEDAAHAILQLVADGTSGIVHVTNPVACTWYELAARALEVCGRDAVIEPVPSDRFQAAIRRPRNSALHAGRLEDLIGAALRPWHEALEAYLAAKGHLT